MQSGSLRILADVSGQTLQWNKLVEQWFLPQQGATWPVGNGISVPHNLHASEYCPLGLAHVYLQPFCKIK